MERPILQLQLTTGNVLIECLPDRAPKHVEQIVKAADSGLYDGTPFHRVIHGFMAQGGATGHALPQLEAEFNIHPHIEGTCSMARTDDPNSASDQFFICFATCPWLDNNYTAWGRVVYGMHNVHEIAAGEPPVEPTRIVRMRSLQWNL